MMGVFLFCGGCGLSEFVFVPIIPSSSVPAHKSGRGASWVLTRVQSPFCETSVTNTGKKEKNKDPVRTDDLFVCDSECWLIWFELISTLTV